MIVGRPLSSRHAQQMVGFLRTFVPCSELVKVIDEASWPVAPPTEHLSSYQVSRIKRRRSKPPFPPLVQSLGLDLGSQKAKSVIVLLRPSPREP